METRTTDFKTELSCVRHQPSFTTSVDVTKVAYFLRWHCMLGEREFL